MASKMLKMTLLLDNLFLTTVDVRKSSTYLSEPIIVSFAKRANLSFEITIPYTGTYFSLSSLDSPITFDLIL